MLPLILVAMIVGAPVGGQANAPVERGGEKADVSGQKTGISVQKSDVSSPLTSDLRPLTSDVRRLEALEQRLQRLSDRQSQAGADWLDQERAAQVRALVDAVLADADSRATLLVGHDSAGYDNGFFLADADGHFRLNVAGEIQVRYVFNHQEHSPSDDNRGGFETRRMQFKADGFVVDPRLRYAVAVGLAQSSGSNLLDSWISYDLIPEVTLTLGRFRPPYLREHEVSSRKQLLVDRSLIAGAFGVSRNQGVAIDFQSDRVRGGVGLVGDNLGAVDFQRWLASARAEVLLFGKWKHLSDFTSSPTEKPTATLGAALRYDEKDRLQTFRRDRQTLGWTADVSIEGRGANFFAAVVGNYPDRERIRTLNQYGVVTQGGIVVAKNYELFARYEWGDANDDQPELSIVTAGVNRYFAQHTLKWTTDVGYAFNPVSSFWSLEANGWRADAPGEDGQIVLRTQFQFLF